FRRRPRPGRRCLAGVRDAGSGPVFERRFIGHAHAGAPTLKGKRPGPWAPRQRMRQAERELAQQAEASYKRTVSDWQAARPAKGGRERDTGARIVKSLKRGQAARQTTSS